MTEPTITCPSCSTEIKLTESLAAPLIRATRDDYEAKIPRNEAEVSKREAAVKAELDAIEQAKESIDNQVAERLSLSTVCGSSARTTKSASFPGVMDPLMASSWEA